MTKIKYPAWGFWRIKTSWFALGRRSKSHLFVGEFKTACGKWINPQFGEHVNFAYHKFYGVAQEDKCKQCLKSSQVP